MPKPPTIIIAETELNRLYMLFGIWQQINDGILTSQVIPGSTVPSNQWSNATSEMVRHYGQGNPPKHVATTHRIADNLSGKVHHWDASDLTLTVQHAATAVEIKFVRIGHDRRGYLDRLIRKLLSKFSR